MCIVLVIGLEDECLIVIGHHTYLLGFLYSLAEQFAIGLLGALFHHQFGCGIVHAPQEPIVALVVTYTSRTDISTCSISVGMRKHVVRTTVIHIVQAEPWLVMLFVGEDDLLGLLFVHDGQVVGSGIVASITSHPVDILEVAHTLDAEVAAGQLCNLEHLEGAFFVEVLPCHAVFKVLSVHGFFHTLDIKESLVAAYDTVITIGDGYSACLYLFYCFGQIFFGGSQLLIGSR